MKGCHFSCDDDPVVHEIPVYLSKGVDSYLLQVPILYTIQSPPHLKNRYRYEVWYRAMFLFPPSPFPWTLVFRLKCLVWLYLVFFSSSSCLSAALLLALVSWVLIILKRLGPTQISGVLFVHLVIFWSTVDLCYLHYFFLCLTVIYDIKPSMSVVLCAVPCAASHHELRVGPGEEGDVPAQEPADWAPPRAQHKQSQLRPEQGLAIFFISFFSLLLIFSLPTVPRTWTLLLWLYL